MSCYAVIASSSDVAHGKFRRLGHFDTKVNIIEILPSGDARLAKLPMLSYEGLLVFAPDFISCNPAESRSILLRRDVTGIFIHPSVGNTPKKGEASNALARLFGEDEPSELIKLKKKTVAFSNGGNQAYKIPSLIAVWQWLMAAPTGTSSNSKCYWDLTGLEIAYDKFLRRDNVDALIYIAINLQAFISPDVATAKRIALRIGLEHLPKNEDYAWIKQDPILKDPANAFAMALVSTNQLEIEAAAEAFLAALRSYVSNLTAEGQA